MSEIPAKANIFVRFDLGRRIEHILLIGSFTTLAVTGLPQKFSGVGISDFIIRLFGGIDSIRVIHHIAAVIFLMETIYHLVVMGYKLFVQRQSASMLPTLQDVKDGLQALGYNLGLSKKRPAMDRYSFDEKLEYWALIWGLVVMAITGFMMWNPVATTSVLPGVFIPAAKMAHGWEAVLAVLAILIWHTYNVHLRHFNQSIWTGKITRKEMEEDHPLELKAIDTGEETKEAIPGLLSKRRQIYYPIAAVTSVVLILLVYRFLTLEVTAISTLPPAVQVPAVQIQTPTPLPTEVPTPTLPPPPPGASLTWNAVIGPLFQQKCGACHGAAGGLDLNSYASALKGGANGPVIVPGNVDGSTLVAMQAAGGHPGQFSADELDQVKKWIEAGTPQ
jgi:cytochrome b subunit of formate dehydrogenase/mono/diheme cytochrome c family protein